ncbi:hypothetical protein PM082_019712 [Marasmius tenuissimus]|nr:hypothetical protein PM082_019712 [Marasmius tenuissimus]
MSTVNAVASTSQPSRTTRQRNPDALRFLDLEAEIDRDDEDNDGDNDGGSLAGFLVDDHHEEYGTRFSHQAINSRLQQEDLTGDNARRSHQGNVSRDHATNRGYQDNNNAVLDHITPPKLWLVHCKVPVLAIAHAVIKKSVAITSLHYRKDGDGALYLDTEDPLAAARILSKCAFIQHHRDSPYDRVDMHQLASPTESRLSLQLPPDDHPLVVGAWVRLSNPKFRKPKPKSTQMLPSDPHDHVPIIPIQKRSYYHGALGLVLDDLGNDEFTILLVPRIDIALLNAGFSISENLKQGSIDYKLGSQIALAPAFLGPDCKKIVDKLSAQGSCFESGLRLETVGKERLVPIMNPPAYMEMRLFETSNHPGVRKYFPPVLEWVFGTGEMVVDMIGGHRGVISSVMKHGVEVEVSLSEGVKELRAFGWAIRKIFDAGQYVRHESSSEGWVVGNDGERVCFWQGGESSIPYAAHRNSLRRVEPSFSGVTALTQRHESMLMESLRLSNKSQDQITRTLAVLSQKVGYDPQLLTPHQLDQSIRSTNMYHNPWKHWSVWVFKGMHRGRYHVLDLVVSKDTKSGLKLQVRTDIVNASRTVMVDYDHVVDADLLLPLHILHPLPPTLAPPPGYIHPGLDTLKRHRMQIDFLQEEEGTVKRAATPPPEPATPPPEPASTEPGPWAPEAEQPSLMVPAPSLADDWWRSTHPSHHQFYELDGLSVDQVQFQVKLEGVVPEFKNKAYTHNAKSSKWFSVYFRQGSGKRMLAMEWNHIKACVPRAMVIYPQHPNKKTNLPFIVLRGELKGSVVTKVAGVGMDLFVLPVIASTGIVDNGREPFKVAGEDCCVIRLQDSAHNIWRQFKYTPMPST